MNLRHCSAEHCPDSATPASQTATAWRPGSGQADDPWLQCRSDPPDQRPADRREAEPRRSGPADRREAKDL